MFIKHLIGGALCFPSVNLLDPMTCLTACLQDALCVTRLRTFFEEPSADNRRAGMLGDDGAVLVRSCTALLPKFRHYMAPNCHSRDAIGAWPCI